MRLRNPCARRQGGEMTIKTWRERIGDRGVGNSQINAMESEIDDLRGALADADYALRYHVAHEGTQDERYQRAVNAAVDAPPVDRSNQILADGSPVPADYSHTQDRGDGQQKGYIVLTAEERAKGFVRPVRQSYVHLKCGEVTLMGLALAETWARDVSFYSGTYCCNCRTHFPVAEFTWEATDEVLGT